jgi:hypothetical protein
MGSRKTCVGQKVCSAPTAYHLLPSNNLLPTQVMVGGYKAGEYKSIGMRVIKFFNNSTAQIPVKHALLLCLSVLLSFKPLVSLP